MKKKFLTLTLALALALSLAACGGKDAPAQERTAPTSPALPRKASPRRTWTSPPFTPL